MIKIPPVVALLAGTILLSPVAPALAISTEEAPTNADGTAIADPDEGLDDMTSPDYGTGGSATIEVPPIDMPGDSDDYSPPDSEDDPADDPAGDGTPATQGDSGN